MPSLRVAEVQFTPAASGLLLVTAYFLASGNGSDFGNSRTVSCYCEQNGATAYDGSTTTSNTKQSFTVLGVFDIVAGAPVKCGLFMDITGAASLSVSNVVIRAEHVKR